MALSVVISENGTLMDLIILEPENVRKDGIRLLVRYEMLSGGIK